MQSTCTSTLATQGEVGIFFGTTLCCVSTGTCIQLCQRCAQSGFTPGRAEIEIVYLVATWSTHLECGCGILQQLTLMHGVHSGTQHPLSTHC